MTVGEDENVESISQNAEVQPNEAKEKTPLIITLEILKVIKDAQQQHGLRHGDYQRYRGYCSRRIRRLRKVVNLPQGDRRHYKRRDVTASSLVDNRSLMIPLMKAERAWSFAMQLKQEANTEQRKKFHLVSRLRKASIHALALEAICTEGSCDPHTRLESQAYAAWIRGSLHFELHLWKGAMEFFKKAQVVYEKLAEVVPEADKSIYRNRVEELNPSLRYCAYNVGDIEDIKDVDLWTFRTHGDLVANFDALLEKRQHEASGADVELKWKGYSLPLQPERVRLFVRADEQLDAALSRAKNLTDKLQLLEDNLMDCKDATASLREHLRSEQKSIREPGAPLSPLQMLLTFLMYTRLNRTVQRNLLMAEQFRAGDKKSRPIDLARLYEIILQTLQEMSTLPGLESDNELRQEVTSKISLYNAMKCFYIAEYLTTLKRWKEASFLYERSRQYLSNVANDSTLAEDRTRLTADLEKSQVSARAYSVLDEEVTDETTTNKLFRSKKPLAERLDEYKEEPALLTKNPGVVKLPPEMRPIPCKPLFFDLALNFAEFPNLDHKMDAAGKRQNASGLTGFVKGFLGWGGSK